MSHDMLGCLLAIVAAQRQMSKGDQSVVSKALALRSFQMRHELERSAKVDSDTWHERVIEAAHKVLGHQRKNMSDDAMYIRCALCGLKSFNEHDIDQKYCGNCNKFHEHADDYEIGRKQTMTHTYTLAMLEVSPSTHEDIKKRLEAAGYHHAIDPENGRIDMTGIALLPMREPEMMTLTVAVDELDPQQIERIQKFVNSQEFEHGGVLMVEANDVGNAIDETEHEETKP